MRTRMRYLVRDGHVIAVPLPDPDFPDLDLRPMPKPVDPDPLVDSAGHPIGNYL